MTTLQDAKTWKGMKAVDPDGDKIGTIEDVFVDRHTGEPEWAAVKTGLFGMKHTLVPLNGAEQVEDGVVRVPVDKDLVKDAPKVDPGDGLDEDEERRLWEHYGRTDYGDWQGDDKTSPDDRDLAPLATRSDAATGDAGTTPMDGPALVGVRLRRVVIVTVPADDDR